VAPGASPEEISRVYRKLAKIFHPDVGGPDPAGQKMRELNRAYEELRKRR
jgi:curved DNA-binding protein CbpA